MKTTAAVLYGKNKVKVTTYDLPKITTDEVLVKVISNSLCLSTYKAALMGEDHKRVPNDISEKPIMTGHEFAGVIVEVGENLKSTYKVGQKFVLQPAMGLESGYSAGYSYEYFGGNATYCIVPKVAIDLGCLLDYEENYFANGSLAEPMACITGAFEASYHTKPYDYNHYMGIKKDGKLALLGATGPMGLGAIDYALNGRFTPSLVVVTDIDQGRIDRAKSLFSEEYAKSKGITLIYINTAIDNPTEKLLEFTEGKGYDDIMVFVANEQVLIQADDILGNDGCLNFFAGPTDKNFKVPFNFYNAHYEQTHIVGTSGGSPEDMVNCIKLSQEKIINPSYMATHIGGLDSAPNAILSLGKLKAGKCVIYPHIEMPLTAISDFSELGKENDLFKKLAEVCEANNNIWSEKAEKVLFEHFDFDPFSL